MVFPLQHCSHLAKRIEVILSCPSTPQPRCAPTASSPEPDAAQSAILKRGWQKEDLVVLVGAAFQEQGVFGLSHLLRDGCAVSERACQTGKGRDNKLVTEDAKPVGSVRWLSAQVPAGFARRSRMRPLRFRPRANPVDDVASRFGEVLLALPLDVVDNSGYSDWR